jgi:AcrR family transcriptional regulator
MDKRRTDTKERIMKRAMDLFAEKGFDTVSIRSIAREVGITPGSFYNHYISKEELLEAVYNHYTQKIIEPAKAGADFSTMIDRWGVTGFFENLIEMMFTIEHNAELFKLSRIIALEQFKNKTASDIAFKSREANRKLLQEILELMQTKGMIRIESPQRMAGYLSYMMTGFANDYYHYRYVQELKPAVIMEKQKQLVAAFCRDFLHISFKEDKHAESE